jgi:hypothetical protein
MWQNASVGTLRCGADAAALVVAVGAEAFGVYFTLHATFCADLILKD